MEPRRLYEVLMIRKSGFSYRRERDDDDNYNLLLLLSSSYGPSSSAGIATDYWLDGPGSNPGGDEIFRLSRPSLGPTQPRVKWVPGLSRE